MPDAVPPRDPAALALADALAEVDRLRNLLAPRHGEPQPLGASGHELESQLAVAVELGGISIWRHDLRTGRMHYNDHGWRTLGLTPRPEGITLGEARARVHPEDLPRVAASAERALATRQPVDVDARYLRSDGSWRHQMLRRTVLRDEHGQAIAFLGVALDITDQLAQQRRADEISRRFESVTRTAGIGYWLYERGQPNVTWSDELRHMFGLAADEPAPASGAWIDRLVHADDRARLRDATRGWLGGNNDNVKLAFRAVWRDGQVRHLFSHSQVEGTGASGRLLFGVVVDLTEQRRSEQQLRHAQERMALAVRSAGVGTWETDVDSGEMRWDEQMWRLRGREPRPGPVTSEERSACLHADDQALVQQRLQLAASTGQPFEHEFRVVRPDGQLRWLASRSTQFEDPTSGRRVRVGVNWDITDSRTAEAVRQEREIARRESAAKSQFLSRMSHELRTPLNAMLGFAQLLAADEGGDDSAAGVRRRRLAHIRSAGQHLLSLINDALDLSGLESGELRIALVPVALAEVLEQTLPLLGQLHGERRVQLECGPMPGHVMADATRLRQVLLNLLSNAYKYNRPGGRVRVSSERVGAQWLLRVSDDGPGMTEQQLQHLFEPFNRLGAEGGPVEGTGIGLAIVKALVQRMGGSVHAHSRPGAGSVFEVRLVAAEAMPAAAPAAEAAPAVEATAPGGVRELLYIEDNPVNAQIIIELVARRRDLALHVAVDGTSGIAHAQTRRPELILLDMQLPDMDGCEVMRRLRAHEATATIPCIALSANAMPEDIDRALRAGVSDYWTKPLDFKAFMASLDTLFGKAA